MVYWITMRCAVWSRQRKQRSKRMLKNVHLRRFPHPSSLRRTSKYVSLLRISGALHLGIFEQPVKINFFSKLIGRAGVPLTSHWIIALRSRAVLGFKSATSV